ncbi:MAG: hypothetical protein VW039_07025, partial [Halieaceae bacterium]
IFFCLVPRLNPQKRPFLPHVERIYWQLGVFQAVLGYLRDPCGDEVFLLGPDLAVERVNSVAVGFLSIHHMLRR